MEGGTIVTVAKIAMTTVVISKVSKVIGEKEISEIIVCVGVLACGIYIIIGVMPVVHGIQDFANGVKDFNSSIHEGIQGFGNILDKLAFWK